MARIRLGILFGGRSAEFDVSLMSARSVWEAADRTRFDLEPIAITRSGRWVFGTEAMDLLAHASRNGEITEAGHGTPIRSLEDLGRLDVVFPVLHGPFGEDGSVQGMLEVIGVPYVGSGLLGSALGLDKLVQKGLWACKGLPVVEHAPVSRLEWESSPDNVLQDLLRSPGLPCFVKPANMGSSVGISRAETRAELISALELACRYDRRLIVEKAVQAREIECGVLGNDRPEVSVPGEVFPGANFYDYDAKYQPGRSRLRIPAVLPPSVTAEIRSMALRAFATLDCAGMARVDFFLDKETGQLWINELNTIPGFTPTSMFPKVWTESGVSYPALITKLVDLALERAGEQRRHTR